MNINDIFRKFAVKVSNVAGKPIAFIVALMIIMAWAISGPFFGFSNTWQLFINTGTTIATLLMVFLIQNTQNRDARAIHIKLDELIKGSKSASDRVINLEDMPDEEIDKLHERSQKMHQKYESELERRRKARKKRTPFS